MTKARARERAKANAAKKAAKRRANSGKTDEAKGPSGGFNTEQSSISSPRATGGSNFGGARRGASRSR